MLRVAAYTCGRLSVNEFDTLLLQHVVWQRPEEAPRVRDWLLERVSQTIGTQQLQYVLAGLYGRACRTEGKPELCDALRPDVEKLIEARGGPARLPPLRPAHVGALVCELTSPPMSAPHRALRAAATDGGGAARVLLVPREGLLRGAQEPPLARGGGRRPHRADAHVRWARPARRLRGRKRGARREHSDLRGRETGPSRDPARPLRPHPAGRRLRR